MKFSDFDQKSWEDNCKFYDTCLIPFTGLSGLESPPEVTEALERLRDFMEIVENPFKGRIVTYPAIQYSGARRTELVNEVCHKVKSSGFQYVIVLTADIAVTEEKINESDLVLSQTDMVMLQRIEITALINRKIQEMWHINK